MGLTSTHTLCFRAKIREKNDKGGAVGLVVERRTPEREVWDSILTQVAVLCP